ncbi:MAG: epoxyqueuosine reductase QueH [Proteobacteria bacterium]|nr:epoxyqueuosine reductase QueH [Pseudomonadota bacterium]
MKILLHICCGPCGIYPVQTLRRDGHEVMGFFYNPNIHPYLEFVRRRDTLAEWAGSVDLPVIFSRDYDLESFLREVVFRESERCRFCYHLRLQAAAKVARRGKFDALTTTLLYSKFQKHDLISRIGQEAAAREGMAFYYQDFREGWQEGIRISKERGMYRQPYCGCIYSERDRFQPRHDRGVPEV